MPIVEAVGASSGTLSPDKSRAKRIEAAMVEAIKKCQALGITDPKVIKEEMMAAREQVSRET